MHCSIARPSNIPSPLPLPPGRLYELYTNQSYLSTHHKNETKLLNLLKNTKTFPAFEDEHCMFGLLHQVAIYVTCIDIIYAYKYDPGNILYIMFNQ